MPKVMVNRISELNEDELATVTTAVVDRLGELGLTGREAAIEKFREKPDDETLREEGLAQLGDVLTALQTETTTD